MKRFPGVLYLAPEPDEPFRQLIQAVVDCFPNSQPYGGTFDKIFPHLTIAEVNEERRLDSICEEFSAYSKERLPIFTSASQVWLMVLGEEGWEKRIPFDLSKKAGE